MKTKLIPIGINRKNEKVYLDNINDIKLLPKVLIGIQRSGYQTRINVNN